MSTTESAPLCVGVFRSDDPDFSLGRVCRGKHMSAPFESAGSLATWQATRVRVYIDANLSESLDTCALADVINLSPSHFGRAFKRTLGITVHRYVMNRRVEMAQHLMLTTSEALSGIAASCGMTDQSHLTRWFRRLVGETPAAWRRARHQ